MNAPDDDALMRRIQRRDPDALRLLLDRHLPAVHRYLTRLCGSDADADELCQETFLRVWEAAGSYRAGRARFSTWLHRIAHNLCVDDLRRRRSQALPADLDLEHPGPGPEHCVMLSEQDRQLRRALMRLPEAQRSALLLCQVQGLSTREAATVMGTSPRALESLVARARRSLRRHLFAGEADDGKDPASQPSGARVADDHQTNQG